ncbi:MAG: hypothetical protein JWL59_1837 [Chthoniobacteraceae bacterium]|nr:hypothetical protein [Chthoniobacteraceae bacterium]
MTPRKFNFPIPVLIRQAEFLYHSLINELYAVPLGERLNSEKDTPKNNFAVRFKKKLDLLGSGKLSHAEQQGQIGKLTLQQAEDMKEVVRISALARRGARLAFRGEKVRLHKEFLVGITKPATLVARLDRARIILASCLLYGAEMKAHGWLARDAELLAAAIQRFDESGLAQGDASDVRADMSEEKVRAANDVFEDCLKIQYAARLEFPTTLPGTGTARERFLLDEFPPRGRGVAAPVTKPESPLIPPAVDSVAVNFAGTPESEPAKIEPSSGESAEELPNLELLLKNGGKKRDPRKGRSSENPNPN